MGGNIFDNLAAGPGGNTQGQQGGDFDNWNEMVGSAPSHQFGQAVHQSVSQMDPQEYYNHIQPGVGGTDPLGQLAPQQRGGLMQSVLGALGGGGGALGALQQATGIGNMDPHSMSPQDAASVLQWTHQNQPQVFGQVAQQYQNEPNMLQSLLGNKALMTAAGAIGANLLSNQMQNKRQR